jgi:hypothetical protein
MPETHHWFTGAALFLAGSFAFAILVGLIGIKEMVSRKLFAILTAMAVILSGLAWYTAAKQEEQNAFVSANIKRIADTTNVNPNQSAQALADQIIGRISPMQKDLADAKEKLGKLTVRQKDVLYQDGLPIARAAGLTQNIAKTSVDLDAISAERQIDFSKEMELQGARLSCRRPIEPPGVVSLGATQTVTYLNVSCLVLGTRK